MGPKENKRGYARLKRPFIAKFRIHKDEDTSNPEQWDIVTLRNISAGGLSFNYHEKIPPDTVLEFDLELSFSLGHIGCLGVVRRVDKGSAEVKFPGKILIHGIAVEFIDIDEEKRRAINKLVQEFQGS